MTRLQLENQVVTIDKGELASYTVKGHEFIHQKGSLGWGSSDTEMFPIIGPVNEAGFQVQTPRGNAVQDQHGHFRLLPYQLVEGSGVNAVYNKTYESGALVPNKKYPEKSDKEFLSWPYNFQFNKKFQLSDEGLKVTFEISGDAQMPYMLGYHPAFKIHTSNPIIKANAQEISLDEVLKVGSRALQVANCNELTLWDEKGMTIKTEGFKHFMCWTEVRNMICLEPITFYPYAVAQKNLHRGFQNLEGSMVFKVLLQPKS